MADTIVPGAANPLAYNRYAYTYNNPVNFSDPTGHAPVMIDGVSLESHLNPQQQVCDIQCQKAKYYEEESRQNYRRAIRRQQNALAEYDVTVEFNDGISLSAQLEGLGIILTAVQSYDSQYATEEELNWDMMGVTHFIITDERLMAGDGHGLNEEDADDDGEIDLTDDGRRLFTITIPLGALLGEYDGEIVPEPDDTRESIVAHELAHNLTHQGVRVPGSKSYSETGWFGVVAWSKDDYEEYSADAVASWALGSWGNLTDEQEDLIRTNIAQAIIDNFDE